jgi:hypothetical protein
MKEILKTILRLKESGAAKRADGEIGLYRQIIHFYAHKHPHLTLVIKSRPLPGLCMELPYDLHVCQYISCGQRWTKKPISALFLLSLKTVKLSF